MPYSSSNPRHRGAQPGNGNALRHGLYSKNFTESEMIGLDINIKGEFHDEIALARVQVGRLAEMLKDYKSMPFENYIAASNALNNYLDRIQHPPGGRLTIVLFPERSVLCAVEGLGSLSKCTFCFWRGWGG